MQCAVPVFFDVPQPPDPGAPVWAHLAQAPAGSILVFDDHTVFANALPVIGGFQPLGYVASGSGAADLTTLTGLADAWLAVSGIRGIFVDQGPDDTFPSDLSDPRWQLYGQFREWMQNNHPGAVVMLNCAAARQRVVLEPSSGLNSLADRGTLVELTAGRYVEQGPGGWWQSNVGAAEGQFWIDPALKADIAHVVHSCPTLTRMAVVFKLATLRNCQYVFITDRTSARYSDLPTFWDEELRLLDGTVTPEGLIEDHIAGLQSDIEALQQELITDPVPVGGAKAAIVQRIHVLERPIADAQADLATCQSPGLA